MTNKDDALFTYWWMRFQIEFPKISRNDARDIFLSACEVKNRQIEELEKRIKELSGQNKNQKLSEL